MKLDVKPFVGQHCETTATGTLLNQLGIELSEPMLFGLGEGLGFVLWNMKSMNTPFIGGRIKPDLLTRNIVKNLGLSLDVRETSSKDKAWKSVKGLFYVIEKKAEILPIKTAILSAIHNNAVTYLNPSIKNLTYNGIYKASDEIIKWFDNSKSIEYDFKMTAMLMEKAGTGGAIFRNLYRDFLKEAYDLTNNETIKLAYLSFIEIAKNWEEVIALFEKVTDTNNRNYILEASEKMKKISVQEKEAMQILVNVYS